MKFAQLSNILLTLLESKKFPVCFSEVMFPCQAFAGHFTRFNKSLITFVRFRGNVRGARAMLPKSAFAYEIAPIERPF